MSFIFIWLVVGGIGSRTQARCGRWADTGWCDGPVGITRLISRQRNQISCSARSAELTSRPVTQADPKFSSPLPPFPCLITSEETAARTATTMSQRFTVSKSDGERNPSEMQGEVNQLFEGDDPPTCSAAEEEKKKEVVAEEEEDEEVVVVLKGRQTDTCRHRCSCLSCELRGLACEDAWHPPRRLWTDVTWIFNAIF